MRKYYILPMWRWPVVAQKKEASARAKAKINTLHAKLIALAAGKGADPALNTALAEAIHTAKKEGVTGDVIDRAIARGAWLDKGAQAVEEVLYEWYAPGGIAIIVRALTDNRNRTASNIRHIFSAAGGNMGETGSVSNFLFDFCGQITLSSDDTEALERAILETDAQDYEITHQTATIWTDRTALWSVRAALEAQWFTPESSLFTYRPKNYTPITDREHVVRLYKMLEAFDADEDTELVWNNADIDDTLWQEAVQKVESQRFHT